MDINFTTPVRENTGLITNTTPITKEQYDKAMANGGKFTKEMERDFFLITL